MVLPSVKAPVPTLVSDPLPLSAPPKLELVLFSPTVSATPAPAGVEAQLKQEKIGLARADREAKERENALAAGKLFNTEDAARELGELLATVKTEFLKVAACAPLVRSKPDDASAEEYLRKEISVVLMALSESRVPSVAQAHARLLAAAT